MSQAASHRGKSQVRQRITWAERETATQRNQGMAWRGREFKDHGIPAALSWAGTATTRAGCSELHGLTRLQADGFTLQLGGDTEPKVILIHPRAEKHPVAWLGADWDSPCGTAALKSSLGISSWDSCWHSTALGTCNGLRALCTPQENTNSTKHREKQQENALLRDLSLSFFPLDYFYRWGNEARSWKWPPGPELFTGK